MKIVVGQKILNLEELFLIAEGLNIEVEVDAPILNELDCKSIDKKIEAEVPPSHKELKLTQPICRAFIASKLIQILKLKSSAQQVTAQFLVRCLNENLINSSESGLFEALNVALSSANVNLSEKERFILNSLPAISLVEHALQVYKCKTAAGYLTAILAFVMETAEFPLDFYNDYSLSLGRQSQGVVAFKNAMTCMVDKSKKVPTKPDVSEEQRGMNIPQVYNLHAQLFDKSTQYYIQIQSEINSDEASIFQNKKYKELIKLA